MTLLVRLDDRRSKYRNKRTAGFASKKEHRRYQELALLESAGKITNLTLQPRYQLLPSEGRDRAIYYVADFSYWDIERDCRVVEDVKGFKTPEYRLKKRLMKFINGIDIVEIT